MVNFFEHQEEARKSTRNLLIAFLLSVCFIVALVNLCIHLYMQHVKLTDTHLYEFKTESHVYVTLFLLVLIIAGTVYKTLFLMSKGGAYVAASLGGVLISGDTTLKDHRKVLNVVEEMAIASGCAVPKVYILENEDAINAFAAGWTPSEAVIGVTRGCVQKLNREELQGVIAHEFSHILNGDMRLNLWMIGILHGLFLITLVGEICLRSRSHTRYRSKDDKGGGIAAAGLVLYVAGFIGVILGNLIKAAVSRQREYLADSSAVQFTRNPQGISHALRKIKIWAYGSRIKPPEAKEASHLFFGNVLPAGFSGLMATHPPLNERIRRLDPNYTGKDDELKAALLNEQTAKEEEPIPKPARTMEDLHQVLGRTVMIEPILSGQLVSGKANTLKGKSTPKQATGPDFSVPEVQFDFDKTVVLSEECRAWTQNAVMSKVLCYHLYMSQEPQINTMQRQLVLKNENSYFAIPFERFSQNLSLRPEWRFPLAELCIPSLKDMSESQFRQFRFNLRQIIEVDKKLDGFEMALYLFMTCLLDKHFENGVWKGSKLDNWQSLKHSLEIVLGFLATQSMSKGKVSGESVFKAGAEHIPVELLWKDVSGLHVTVLFNELNQGIRLLEKTPPLVKQKILQACMAIVVFDKKVTLTEWDMLRALSACLESPVPL